MFLKLNLEEQVHRMHGSLATTMAILITMLTFCQEHFIANVEQEKYMLEHSIIANRSMDG